MIYTFFLVNAFITAFATVLLKHYRSSIGNIVVKDNIQYVLTIVVALFVFGSMSGFNLKVNLITLIFSAVYAIMAYVSIMLNMRAIDNTDLVTISIFTNSGSIMWNSVWGFFIFSEEFTLKKFIGIVAVLIAIIIPYFAQRSKCNHSMKGIMYCFILFLWSGVPNILIKLFSITNGVMGNTVFCFYTNILMIPFVFIMLKRNATIGTLYKELSMVDKKAVLILMASFALSNIATVCSMIIISKVELMIYGVVEKSLGILVMSVVAQIFLREKISISKFISLLFFIIAVIVIAV